MLERARADPEQPADPRRRAGPAVALRADLPDHRPGRGDAAARRRHARDAPGPGRDRHRAGAVLGRRRRGVQGDGPRLAGRAGRRARPVELPPAAA